MLPLPEAWLRPSGAPPRPKSWQELQHVMRQWETAMKMTAAEDQARQRRPGASGSGAP